MRERTGRELVLAARGGDTRALDRLVAAHLPLVYNVVGRALDGHADVDDVVQETMLRCLGGLPGLRDPDAFRSWLVAIALRQVRERQRNRQGSAAAEQDDVSDPGADFADLTILRLELTGQRREVAAATRWLDPDNRELLSLWWLEASGELSRAELAAALGLSPAHAAVRVQRMRAQLDAARSVVRALRRADGTAAPGCPDLAWLATGWHGRPDPLWRKRFARHTRECVRCVPAWSDLVAADRLLAGLALVPLPAVLGSTGSAAVSATTSGEAAGRTAGWFARRAAWVKPAAAAAGTVTVLAAAAAVYAVLPADPAPTSAPPPPAAAPAAVPLLPPSSTPTASPTATARPRPSTARPAVPAKPAATSRKKGVSTWEFGPIAPGLKAVGAGWYYNWAPSNQDMPGPAGVEFVPMIWGAANVTDSTLATAQAQGGTILGFNEPDLGEQANMSVQRALELWPRLQATGRRLGSPAPAWGGADPGGWLDRFMAGARQRGYRVDFIALHWYGSDFSAAAVGHLRSYLAAVHARYGKPIWLTEFALIRFDQGGATYPSGAQQAAFVTGATTMLEGLSYVERYAWFGLPSTPDSGTGLYTAGGALTAAGKAYRAAG